MSETEQFISSKTRSEQLIILDILKQVKIICDKHNIKYWLAAGTLLDCVRIGGFIPWDNDLDIAMLQKDYNKFRKIAPKEYFYQTKVTDKYCPNNFAKVRKIEHYLSKKVKTILRNITKVFFSIFFHLTIIHRSKQLIYFLGAKCAKYKEKI